MIRDLEQALGYHFRNITLVQNALTHSSYANERWRDSLASNERLEFLGDSILGMITAEHLYCTFPNRPEGELSRIRADLVCETNLAKVAGQLHLGSYLLLGHGEEQGGRPHPGEHPGRCGGVRAGGCLSGRGVFCRLQFGSPVYPDGHPGGASSECGL